MKILFVNGHLRVGGVEKSLVNLLKAIDYSKHDVDLLLFEGLGDYIDDIPKEVNIILYDLTNTFGSVKSVFFNAIKQRSLKTIGLKTVLTISSKCNVSFTRLLRFFHITDNNYDVAIAYRIGISADYVSYAIHAKKKILWWHHGEYDYSDTTTIKWNKMMHNIDRIVCVSNTAKRIVETHLPEQSNKLYIIPNIVDKYDLQKKATLFNPYSSVAGKIIIVSVGRFSPEKHMLDILQVVDNLLQRSIKDFVWYLVGDGVQKSMAEEYLHSHHLEEYIVVTGSQANPYPYMNYSNIFVHPSHVESQGITVLEALALGKLSVVVNSNGTKEFIRDGINAFQAEPTIKSLTEKVVAAIEAVETIDLHENQSKTVDGFLPERIIHFFDDLIGVEEI